MAVPSSGEVSLWGIAQEMIRNSYTAHQEISPATNNDNLVQSTSESDMLLVQNGPNSTYGYFHPLFKLKEEDNSRNHDKTRIGVPPSQPDVGKGGDPSAIDTPQDFTGLATPFGLNQAYDNAMAVVDISLGGMTSNNNNFSSRVMSHAIEAPASSTKFGPTTLAYRQTYGQGPDPDGLLLSAGETDSTIMYTIFRAGSGEVEAHVVSHTPGLYSPHPRAPAGSPVPAVTYVNSAAVVSAYEDSAYNANTIQIAPTSINTNNPSDNRPDTTSSTNQAAMSEWYSYDHDAVALATAGFYASTALFTGDGGTSLYHYTKNISDFANGDVVNLPSDFTFRLVLMHKQAASGGQPYQADIQLTAVKYNTVAYPLANPFPANWTPGSETQWLTTLTPPGPSSQNTQPFDPTPATTAGAETVFNGIPSRAPVSTAGTNGKWNWQADGEGPSSNTGVPDPTGGFFFESSSGTRRNEWSILETTEIPDLTSDSITFSMYRFGAGIGTAFMGIRIVEA